MKGERSVSQAQSIAYSKAFCKRTWLELEKEHLAEDSEMASVNQILHRTLKSRDYLPLSLWLSNLQKQLKGEVMLAQGLGYTICHVREDPVTGERGGLAP